MKKEKFNKETIDKVKELGPREFELALLGYLRYSMGRRSYIVGACSDYLISLLPVLSDWCLNNIEDDLENYAADVEKDFRSWGDECDKTTWLKLWDNLVIEMRKRQENE